jgi:hypothetical protein
MAISTRMGMSRVSLTLALLACASGCLRFGYAERTGQHGDAGSKGGHLPDDSGVAGTRSGSGAVGGSGGSGAGGNAGVDAPADSGAPSTDAGASDAGPTDAAQRDADPPDDEDAGATDAGTFRDCPEHPGVILCDGFEDGSFSRWSYPVVTNGTLGRSTARSHTGAASLRATTGVAAAGNEARYAASVLANQKSGHIWMRYYYFVPSTVTVTSHFSAGVMSEIMEPYAGFAMLVRPSRVDLTTMDGPFQGTMTFPRDRWVCVELHVQIDPQVGLFEGYLDGVLAVSSTPTNTLPGDGFMNAEVGIHYAEANQGPVEVYVDDVMIARTRVPCD